MRLCLMNNNSTSGTSVTVEKVLHNATFTKCVEALCDGGGVNEKTAAETTAYVREELVQRQRLFIRVTVGLLHRHIRVSVASKRHQSHLHFTANDSKLRPTPESFLLFIYEPKYSVFTKISDAQIPHLLTSPWAVSISR